MRARLLDSALPPPQAAHLSAQKAMKKLSIAEKLKHYVVDANAGCWIWPSAQSSNGYGLVWDGAKMVRAHRFFYEHHIGPIPAGFQLDHLCRVRLCVNPKHLELVTPRQNVLRGIGICAENAKKTHCKYGHSDWKARKDGWECMECRRITDRRRWEERKEKINAKRRKAAG